MMLKARDNHLAVRSKQEIIALCGYPPLTTSELPLRGDFLLPLSLQELQHIINDCTKVNVLKIILMTALSTMPVFMLKSMLTAALKNMSIETNAYCCVKHNINFCMSNVNHYIESDTNHFF